MEHIDIQIRLAKDEERAIEGIAVPFGQTINVGGFQERFERGAIDGVDGVMLFWRHEEPIGMVTAGSDTDEGFLIRAKISETPRGNEAYTLLRDGVIDRMSVGFMPVEDSVEDGVTVRTKVDLKEVSLVPFPAYSKAKVLAVREEPEITVLHERKDPIMENTNEIAELRSAIDELDRKVAVAVDVAPVPSVPQFRTYGDFIKGIASHEEAALDLAKRVFDGGVLADSITQNAWVSDVIRLVDAGRPSLNTFRKAALPTSGMAVEYPVLETNTIDVDEQVAEGDTLVFGKITLASETAAVKTFGGYTTMSRQVIERSNVNYLDVAFRAMALAYAKRTNAEVIAALGSATGSGSSDGTAAGWYNAIADAALDLNGGFGLKPEFILVSGDIYKAIAVLFDSNDRPIVGGNMNGVGSSNVVGLSASIGGLPVVVDAALDAGTCYISNREALVTYESAGAPLRLSDSDVTALTNSFSVYGYAAVAVPMPDAIIKVTVA